MHVDTGKPPPAVEARNERRRRLLAGENPLPEESAPPEEQPSDSASGISVGEGGNPMPKSGAENQKYQEFMSFVNKPPERLVIETDIVDVEIYSRHVCVSEDQVCFSLDKDQIKFNPKKDSQCILHYRDQKFPLHYYGGNFTFPGLPFQFISFFIIDEEDKP
jgi:hypothetical protein